MLPAGSQQPKTENKEKEEMDQCVVCFDKESECLIMPCKHSGICKGCSIELIEKSDAICMFCRVVKIIFLF